ncbi:hypothetical protein IFM89_007551 [Coptis chinensis]|uniref:Plantacyanin n=1 Tax=Coptis chinensis TaxID=261450 RepID=A0A835HWC8_9MAGN|nr:hypothetical protein IFM89_007551 [Coptis chinensis]
MRRSKCMKVLFLALLITAYLKNSDAATHQVGETNGWGFSVSYTDWANEKSFAAGDTLVFNYPASAHNVVPVKIAGYRSCKALPSDMTKAQATGNDKFTLKKGANYFICSYAGHCSSGMKIQVNAT